MNILDKLVEALIGNSDEYVKKSVELVDKLLACNSQCMHAEHRLQPDGDGDWFAVHNMVEGVFAVYEDAAHRMIKRQELMIMTATLTGGSVKFSASDAQLMLEDQVAVVAAGAIIRAHHRLMREGARDRSAMTHYADIASMIRKEYEDDRSVSRAEDRPAVQAGQAGGGSRSSSEGSEEEKARSRGFFVKEVCKTRH